MGYTFVAIRNFTHTEHSVDSKGKWISKDIFAKSDFRNLPIEFNHSDFYDACERQGCESVDIYSVVIDDETIIGYPCNNGFVKILY